MPIESSVCLEKIFVIIKNVRFLHIISFFFFFRKYFKNSLYRYRSRNIPLSFSAGHAALRSRNNVKNPQRKEHSPIESEIWFSRARHHG